MLGRLKHRLLKLLEYLCTLNTLPTSVQSLDRINWEIKSPLAQRSGAKKPRESQNAPLYPQSPSFILQEGGRINVFFYFVQDCACVVVILCVSSKYINQLSGQVIPDTVQITSSRMGTCTQNRILHHEGCPARSLNPWKKWDIN